MKTLKISTTIATLNLVLFMSVSSIAKPFTHSEGDLIKSGVKNQIEVVKSTITEVTSDVSSENQFGHLKFDASKFNTETEVFELPLNTMDYLRFDASDFYLTSDLSEMPVDEFGYLRFDVNNYPVKTSVAIDELPVN
jgi:hypothetical protein